MSILKTLMKIMNNVSNHMPANMVFPKPYFKCVAQLRLPKKSAAHCRQIPKKNTPLFNML